MMIERSLRFLGVVLLGLGLAYECSRHVQWPWALAVALTVSLTHFYYDGFVWSVRRREV